MSESLLPGGFVNDVVRVGATVRRRTPARAVFVHRLLALFERLGWEGAPRFQGVDEKGREVLSFLSGHVAWEPVQPDAVGSDSSLVRVAELMREFHDMTAGTPLAQGDEVVCHNDLSPKNTVYRDFGVGLRPVAFIDWDDAAPGRRIHDVAHVCWQYLRLGTAMIDVSEACRGIRLICDAYGLTGREEVVDTILWWQDRCWRGIDAAAAAGDPAMMRLRASDAFTSVQIAYRWVVEHRLGLESGVA